MSGENKLYRELTLEENAEQQALLLKSWSSFIKTNDPSLTEKEIFINNYTLMEVIERVSKRKYYYRVFHGIEHLSEFKEIALICFWVCKLKPFTILNPISPLCASANELFAVHLMLTLIEGCKEYSDSFRIPDSVSIKNLVYALKYQDITKEAMILYFESLALACGINLHDSSANCGVD